MKTRLTLINLLVVLCAFAQNPQSQKATEKWFPEMEMDIKTPAFQKDKGFTTYNELMAFLDEHSKAYPEKLSYSFIGKSQKGKDIPLVKITSGNAKEKLKFWIQAGLHGNEPASTEGILHLINELLTNPENEGLLQSMEIAIVPMANIDGYEKQNRYAANGLDLNRDQTKFTAPESVFLKTAFSAFNADVAMDFHEYRPYRRDYMKLGDWGVNGPYDVMFLYSGNQNVPRDLRVYTKENFVKTAKERMTELGFRNHDYFSTGKYYGEIQLNRGSLNSRSSATSYALANCVSTLIEVRGVGIGRTSFKRRSFITYSVAMSYLNYASQNKAEVLELVKKARGKNEADVVVLADKDKTFETVKMLDNYSNEMLQMEFVVNDAWVSHPTLTRKRPNAYLILPGNDKALENLKILGLEIETLSTEKTISVEALTVFDYFKDALVYEGVHRQEVTTVVLKKEVIFPVGTSIVYLAQDKGNIATEVLEPEGENSFVSFNVIGTSLYAELPVYRYMQQNKIN